MMMAAACNFLGGASRRPARQHKDRRIGGRPSHFFYFAGTLAAATLLLLVVFGPPREVAPRRLEKSQQQHQQQRGDSNSRSPGLEIAPSLPEEEKEELPSSSPLVKTRKRQHRVVKYQSFFVDRTPRRGDEDRGADGRHRYAGSGGEGSTGSGGGSSVLELRKSIVLDSYVDKGPASPRRPNSRQGYHKSDVGRSNIDAGSGGKSLADVAAAATTSRHERHLLRGHRHLAKERPWPHPVESIIVEEDGWSNVGEDDDLNLMFYRKSLPIPVPQTAYQRLRRYLLHVSSSGEAHGGSRSHRRLANQGRSLTNGSDPPSSLNPSLEIILPAVLISIAAVVVVCAIILLVIDLRDRCHERPHLRETTKHRIDNEDINQKKKQKQRKRNGRGSDINRNEASSNSSAGSHEEGNQGRQRFWRDSTSVSTSSPMAVSYFRHSSHGEDAALGVTDVLPVLTDGSLSAASTMTNSFVDDSVYEEAVVAEDGDEIVATTPTQPSNQQHDIAEVELRSTSTQQPPFTINERVLNNVGLMTLPERSSALYSLDCEDAPGVRRDQHLVNNKFNKMTEPSIKHDYLSSHEEEAREDTAVSSTTPQDEDRESMGTTTNSDHQLSQLKHILLSIPVDGEGRTFSPERELNVMPETIEEEYIRDVYFVPFNEIGGPSRLNSLGLDIVQPIWPMTHPSIVSVSPESPLSGRIFPGDVIVSVNDRDMASLEPQSVLKHIRKSTGSTIKITVLSTSDIDDGGVSVEDYGLEESAVEI